ncbi:MAG: hypothetical protein AAF480_00665 [Actinomycetota bacterium]
MSTTEAEVDLTGIADPMVDPLLPAGRALLALTDAIVLRDEAERDAALDELVPMVGTAGAVRAAAVVGNFEMMNRNLDAMGIGPSTASAAIAPDLGVPWPQ